MTLTCLWFGQLTVAVQRQRRAVQWVEQQGGLVRYDWQYRATSAKGVVRCPGPPWLRAIVGDDYFQTVDLVNITSADVRDLSPLADLPQLRVLWVPGNRITDLTPLAELRRLEELYVFKNSLQDIAVVAHMPKLRVFSAQSNRIEDRTPLLGLHNIELCDLSDNPIDETLTH